MDLILRRLSFRHDGILGELYAENGSFYCSTLEHAYPQNSIGFVPKVPVGMYVCKKGLHRLTHMARPFETYEITGVKGHQNILFHAGNFNNDSEGCVLVGEFEEEDPKKSLVITNSQHTFQEFMKAQNGTLEFVVTVIDHNFSDMHIV